MNKLKRVSPAQMSTLLKESTKTSPSTAGTTGRHPVNAAYVMSRNDYDGIMLHLNENLFSGSLSHDQTIMGELHRYPSGGDQALRTAAAMAFGLSPNEVFTAVGSSHAICLLLLRFAPVYKKLILPSPTWSYYRACTQSLDVEIIDVPLQIKDHRYSYDVMALDAAIKKEGPALVILVTPNNPTGNTLSYEYIRMIATNHPDSTIVVDEAYFGFSEVDHQQSATLLRQHDNVVIIRSLSKAYGLAGLRVGFALASGAMRDAIAAYFLPFGLPDHVQKVAASRILDWPFLKSINAACAEAQEVFRASLADVTGLTVYRSDANFCLVQVPQGTATILSKQLEDNGYIIKCLSESQLRITMAQPKIMRDVAKIIKNGMVQ